ncbi:MAG: flagellar hook-length control protein FliK [Candidatus Tectomicrobia bacterium]|nr:flagellar hook-length control protein FliK [Candidatus Tectomicrobia bacterium]
MALASAAAEDAAVALQEGNLPSGAMALDVNLDTGTSHGQADRQASAARSAAVAPTLGGAASAAANPALAGAAGDAGAEAPGGGPAERPDDKASLASFLATGKPALHPEKVGKPFDLSQSGTPPQHHDASLLGGAARGGAEVHAQRADEAFDLTLGNLGRDGGLAAGLGTQGDAGRASAAAPQTLGTGANPPPPAQMLTQLLEQIAGRATSLVRQGQHTLQIQLRPEELGRLSLKIVTNHDKVTASFLVESTAVKELLENNVAQLRASLHDQGLRFDGLQVNISNQPRQGFEQQLGSERGPHPGWDRAERLTEAIDPGAQPGGAAAGSLALGHRGVVHLVA